MTDDPLLRDAADRAVRYLAQLPTRAVAPTADALARLSAFDQPLPERRRPPAAVLAELDDWGSPGTVATAGGRYFGFVIGGALPVTVATAWLAAAWDQNAGLIVQSPVAAKIEEVTLRWVLDLLRFPPDCAGAFVTGATMANFTGLAAARHAILARKGWDVEARGLFSAPPIRVVVGDEVHVSLLKALTLLGLGHDRVVRVPADDQGRLRIDGLPPLDDQTILCVQVGNVNTGACDPVGEACRIAHRAGAWVHVDGAFGLWAAAAPTRAGLVAGLQDADSWAVDVHKWLNVPYDSGIALCRDAAALSAAMSSSAPYLVQSEGREPLRFGPEMSRRARGVEVWAALASLGREGVADLVERTCRHAATIATGLRKAGYDVPHEVVLNQVLVRFGDDETTREVIAAVQRDGTCWCGGTVWQGSAAMRISISSWATSSDDVAQSLDAILRCASAVAGQRRQPAHSP